MSGIPNSSLNGSTSNISDSSGRHFTTSFSSQSAAAPGFHHSGSVQGLHNMHGSYNVPNMPGSLASRSAAMSGVLLNGVQQPGGSISSGRFASNNLATDMSQISHGHPGVVNRGNISVVGSPGFNSGMNGVGGPIPGLSASSVNVGDRNSLPGLGGVSPMLGVVGPRITSSTGNMYNGGSIGRSIGSGGLSASGLSRLNLAANSGSGVLNFQGPNRFMSGMLQQAPQMMGSLGNSYPTSGGHLSQSHMQVGNNMGMLNDLNSSDNAPFDLKDFPQLTGRPNSAGGQQGQLGSLRKQGLGVSSIVQQSQEFSIQNEDFPALSGFKGGSSDYSFDMHQKDQLHENVSMVQPQHFSMARSAGFSLGGSYASTRQPQQQHGPSMNNAGMSFAPGNNQDLLHIHGSDLLSSHGRYHSQIQNSGGPSMQLRQLNSTNPNSGMGGTYDQLIQQYHQQSQNQSQHRGQQISVVSQLYRDLDLKNLSPTDLYGLPGLLIAMKSDNPDLTSLAMGIDLTTLGLNLNAPDNLYKTFGSPWSEEPAKGEPEYCIPSCYNARSQPPLQQGLFSKVQLRTLFYIFYSMPKDEAQIFAACELYARGWFYHKETQLWFMRLHNVEPLVKSPTYERGSYLCFDPNTWETMRKDNFVIQYEAVEKKPTLPPVRPQN